MTEKKFPVKKVAVSIGGALLAVSIGGVIYKITNPTVDTRLIIVCCILGLAIFTYGISIIFKNR